MEQGDKEFNDFEDKVFSLLDGKLSGLSSERDIIEYIEGIVKTLNPATTKEMVDKIVKDSKEFDPLDKYIHDENVEDVMVNNTRNVFIYKGGEGLVKVGERVGNRKDLQRLVTKLRMYTTSNAASKHIFDVHLPNGSRANIVHTPIGENVTIRNYKANAFSVIDLVNAGELSYQMAARLWLYSEGLKVRPANMLIGGMPGAGKSTLLNAMFSFFRPEERIVVIEDTYELNTTTQENCVRLETDPEVSAEELLKNVLRMRPDIVIVGEVRGAEARDMMAAMSIGKIAISTIHASTARDMIMRLQQTPMDVPMSSIPLIDVMMIVSQINAGGLYKRKVTQISEISGIETQVLLSDLYLYDYKTGKGSDILPSVTYRDDLAGLSGYSPAQIISEENRRAVILEKLNKLGTRDMAGINEFCRDYYIDPERALDKIGLKSLGVLSYDK